MSLAQDLARRRIAAAIEKVNEKFSDDEHDNDEKESGTNNG